MATKTDKSEQETSTPEGDTKGETSQATETKNSEQSKESKSTATSTSEGKKDDVKPTESTGKQLTQDEVNTLIGTVRKETRTKAENDLLKELGVETKEDITNLIKAADDAKREQMSELERLTADLTTANTQLSEAQKRQTDLEADATDNRIRAAVVSQAAGKFHNADAAYALLDMSKLNINEDTGAVEGVDEALKQLAEAHPYLIKKRGQQTSVTNPDAGNKAERTDADRKAEYFGMSQNPFWEGRGVRRVIQED